MLLSLLILNPVLYEHKRKRRGQREGGEGKGVGGRRGLKKRVEEEGMEGGGGKEE